MFTLYINEYPLRLCGTDELGALPPADENHLRFRYQGQPRSFFPYLDAFEKGTQKIYSVAFVCENPASAQKDLLGLFVIVEAAGGVVFDPNDRILAMYRRGWWDLPKGKIDPGETAPEAAIREVWEETSAPNLVRGEFIGYTYHAFRLKDKRRAIKFTHWYRMTSTGGALVPQAEEGIEAVAWFSKDELLDKNPLYRNIEDLLGRL